MDNRRFRKRISTYGTLTLMAFVLLLIHLFRIQVYKHEYFKDKSDRQIRSFYKESGKRGRIIASTGEELAYDTYESDLIIDPKRFAEYKYGVELLEYLKEYKKFSVEGELDKLYSIKDKRYYKLITDLTSNQRSEIEKKLKELKVIKNEVFFEKRNKRIYNSEEMFRHIVGFMGYSPEEKSKIVGRFGIEKYYEEYLNPEIVKVERFLSGNRKREIPTVDIVEVNPKDKNGDSIVLTIDYVIQYIMQNEFSKFIDEYNPNWVAGIMMNPKTGEIYGMTSLPVHSIAHSRNNAVQNRYEPGSVFKPLIVAAALEEGFINEDDIFSNPTGSIKKFGATMRDASRSARGELTPEDILIQSSNVGMVMVAEEIPTDIYEYYLKKFGLYDKTEIEFLDEPFIKQEKYEDWDGLKKYSMSFGQGIAITPLQMATSFSAVINGGNLVKPTLVKEIIKEDGEKVYVNKPFVEDKVISEKTSQVLKGMLRSVVEKGTGKNARIEGYDIGGKTGTSQKSGVGGYAKDKFIISFAGFYPVEDPEYLLLVVADEPKSDSITYGGALMAPLFKEIMTRVFTYKKILPKEIDVVDGTKPLVVEEEDLEFVLDIMPELTNLSSRQVIQVFEETSIEVELIGRGLVYKQVPQIGKNMKDVKKVKVYLKE